MRKAPSQISLEEEDIESIKEEIPSLESLSSYPVELYKKSALSRGEETELFSRLSEDPDNEVLRNKIIVSNLGLVMSWAAKKHRLLSTVKNAGVISFWDLVQDGSLGLLLAIKKFDVNKGFKFSTYASHWIRQAMDRAIQNTDKTIRLPVHKEEELTEFFKATGSLTQITGCEPSPQEICEEISKTRLSKAVASLTEKLGRDPTPEEISKKNSRKAPITVARILEIKKLISRQTPLLLETPIIQGEKDISLMNIVPDENVNLERETEEKLLSDDILNIMKGVLTAREIRVLVSRFELKGAKKETLEQIGEHYDLTRERIRQIESEAIEKLRENPESNSRLRKHLIS